jgi:hypothetical protein
MKLITSSMPVPAAGWVRRPELDSPTYDAWEMPSGDLYTAKKGVTPRLLFIEQKPLLRSKDDYTE